MLSAADGVQFDEGIAGIENRFGTDFALPTTAEKGYVDVAVKLSVPGGHSSTPPDHTASECFTCYAHKG